LHWGVQSLLELVFPLMTIGAIAIVCATIACFYGLRTRGGPADVGASVARSLFVNLVLLHVIASVFAFIVYGAKLGLPIAP
jgi:phospholipid/cholesterol/gamma-HCH transport system permease protein